MGALLLVGVAASVYLVYVLEILKLRRLRAWQLRREDPDTSEHEIDARVERELETGEFRSLARAHRRGRRGAQRDPRGDRAGGEAEQRGAREQAAVTAAGTTSGMPRDAVAARPSPRRRRSPRRRASATTHGRRELERDHPRGLAARAAEQADRGQLAAALGRSPSRRC